MCEHQTAPIRPHRGQTSTHLTPAYVTSRILSAEAAADLLQSRRCPRRAHPLLALSSHPGGVYQTTLRRPIRTQPATTDGAACTHGLTEPHLGDSQRHKPCRATKIKVAASFTMHDERSITTCARAARGEEKVGKSRQICGYQAHLRRAQSRHTLGQVKYTRSRLGIWAWQQHPCSTHLAVV